MKIALFTHVAYPFTNGVAVSVEQLAKELNKRHHDVTIVTNNYDSFHNDFTNEEKLKVSSIPLFYQKLRTPIIFNPQLMHKLVDKKIEIVHSHSDFGQAILAREYSKYQGVPLIHTYHCNYLDYAKENFSKISKLVFYEPVKLYTKMLCYTADRMIVPSLETKRLLNDDFKIKKDLDYIPNGIDLSKFKKTSLNIYKLKASLNIQEDDFILLSVSRLSKEKGLSNIISLLPKLKECSRLKLLIVGTGPDENRLKNLVNELKLDNVIFTGEIPFKQIQDYYQLGNVFISNSQAETQGLSVIEALSSSLPAICPNTPIFREIINNNNGFLFDNYDELISIIKMYYNNEKELLFMRENAQRSVNHYLLENSVNKIERIYEEEREKKLKKKH